SRTPSPARARWPCSSVSRASARRGWRRSSASTAGSAARRCSPVAATTASRRCPTRRSSRRCASTRDRARTTSCGRSSVPARDRLLILGAYRDVELDRAHPLSEVLGALRRLPNYRRVLLRGLPQETITDLLTVIDPSEEGAAGRQALAAALYQETEGNPFFI